MAEPAFSGDKVERRLAAILAADVVGYSRLMGEDEASTLRRLKIHRLELIDPLIARHKGRIVKLMGDGALVEFGSVVEAVACAVAIQRGMAERETELPEAQKIRFRIGVNTGDVIIEGDDIYGDGVNIAARLEGLAEPGGICVAESVVQQVKGKLPVGFTALGAQKVKNIAEPVQAFKVDLGPGARSAGQTKRRGSRRPAMAIAATVVVAIAVGAGGYAWYRMPAFEPAKIERMAYPLPEKPSIAVLAFTNLTGDPTRDTLAEGLAEDVTTALSKIADIFVIARNSAFAYKDKNVKARQVSEDLGVRYVVEGSLRQIDDKLRLNVNLVDALTGHQIWSDRSERDATGLLGINDRIVLNIVSSIGAKISQGERDIIARQGTQNLEAWQLWREASILVLTIDQQGLFPARRRYEQALALDPNFLEARAGLAHTFTHEARQGMTDTSAFDKAETLFRQNLLVDPTHAETLSRYSYLFVSRSQFEEARKVGVRAVATAPNDWNIRYLHGTLLHRLNEFDEALSNLQLAMRLYPSYPNTLLSVLARVYMFTGKEDQAVQVWESILQRNASPIEIRSSRSLMAVVLWERGKAEEAKEQVALARAAYPATSISHFVKAFPFKDTSTTHDRWARAWRALGMPE